MRSSSASRPSHSSFRHEKTTSRQRTDETHAGSAVQIGTVDALLVQLCIRHELVMLTTDRDFEHAAKHLPLVLWTP